MNPLKSLCVNFLKREVAAGPKDYDSAISDIIKIVDLIKASKNKAFDVALLCKLSGIEFRHESQSAFDYVHTLFTIVAMFPFVDYKVVKQGQPLIKFNEKYNPSDKVIKKMLSEEED